MDDESAPDRVERGPDVDGVAGVPLSLAGAVGAGGVSAEPMPALESAERAAPRCSALAIRAMAREIGP